MTGQFIQSTGPQKILLDCRAANESNLHMQFEVQSESSSVQMKTSLARPCAQAILSAAAIFAIYLFMCGRSTLWDRDEPRFSRATVEMIQSGNYLYPTLNRDFSPAANPVDYLRADKPILIYWLMSLPVRILGPTEIACRFFSALGTAISCLLIFYMGRRLFDASAGLWAMWIYSVTLLAGMIGTAATADSVTMALNLGVLAVAVSALWGNGLKLWHFAAMSLLFGLAMLCKSPFGLLPLVAVLGMALINRFSGKPLPLGWKFLAACTLAAIIGAGIYFAWFIPADLATVPADCSTESYGFWQRFVHGRFFELHFGKHIAQRATSTLEHHGGGGLKYIAFLPFYAVVIVLAFFPWTFYLPASISGIWGAHVGDRRAKVFLFGWVIFTFLLMSLTVTKLPHYILIVFPAISLMVAATIRAAASGQLSATDRTWLSRGSWLFWPVACGIILAAAAAFVLSLSPGAGKDLFMKLSGAANSQARTADGAEVFSMICSLGWPLCAAGLVVLVTCLAATLLNSRGRARPAAKTLLYGMVALQIVIAAWAVPAMEKHKLAPELARAVRQNSDASVPVYWCGYEEPSFMFYTGRHVEKIGTGGLSQWAHGAVPAVLAVSRTDMEKNLTESDLANLQQIGEKQGFNYSNGHYADVVVLKR